MSSNQKGPDYYRRGSIQVWDFIRDQGLSFHLGNSIKYICRAGHKDSRVEDLKKAIHYLENELEHALQVDEPPAVRCEGVSPEVPFAEWLESELAPSSALFNL